MTSSFPEDNASAWHPEQQESGHSSESEPLERRGRGLDRICLALLWISIGAYILLFLRFTFHRYDRYGMMAYDLGIFDQAVWLISKGYPAYISVRGLHLLADHFSIILYLLAPIYWIWDNPRALLTLQTAALALGALPIYSFARCKTQSAPIALLFALAYLLYPAMQWSNADEFHPDTLATLLLLCAFYTLTKRQWLRYALLLITAALVKESVGLTIIMMGIYVCYRIDRRVGIYTIGGGLAAATIALKTISHFNHGFSSAYFSLYSGYGNTPTALATHLLQHPILAAIHLNTEATRQYLAELLRPLLFLPLLAPDISLIAAPAILLNLLSYRENMHSVFGGQYTALITPFLLLGAVTGFDRFQRRLSRPLTCLLLTALCIYITDDIRYTPFFYTSSYMTSIVSEDIAQELDKMLKQIPSDASVSAQFALASHLTHRRQIYLYPNPFYGIAAGSSITALQQIDSLLSPPYPSPSLIGVISHTRIDYIALCPPTSTFPLNWATYIDFVTITLQSPRYGIIVMGRDALLLKRGADHQQGLALLAARSGSPIHSPQDIYPALQAWMQHPDKNQKMK